MDNKTSKNVDHLVLGYTDFDLAAAVFYIIVSLSLFLF
jgi:hypothetical protein